VAKIRKIFRANPLAIDPPGRKISKTESANSNMGPAPASGQEWGSSNENENFTRHPFHSTWPISTGRKILVKSPERVLESNAHHHVLGPDRYDPQDDPVESRSKPRREVFHGPVLTLFV
jgi:hypothetical protein